MVANVIMPISSSGRSADTNSRAAAWAAAALRFMLPLESIASMMVTGRTDSWNVSTFCRTPSSSTSRSSRVNDSAARPPVNAVNSSSARTGGGAGAV